MIDKAISVGTTFDWITPLWALIQDWRNRPSVGYSVPVDGGSSLYAIKGALTGRGVKTWGWMIVDGVILFRTRQAQAQYAQYWLERDGVPYSGGTTKRQRPARRRHARQRRQDGVLGTLAKWAGGK